MSVIFYYLMEKRPREAFLASIAFGLGVMWGVALS